MLSFLNAILGKERGKKSMLCKSAHFDEAWYRKWASQIAAGSPPLESFGADFAKIFAKVWEAMIFSPEGVVQFRHRKMWEWCLIAETLSRAGMLAPGKRGCGFAVGREPLASLFAAAGADILVTDLATESDGWATSGQQAASLMQSHWPLLVSDAAFQARAKFQPVDMRDLTPLAGQSFDFIWSSCSFEHLGGIEAGLKFVEDSTDLLAPGGIAVHTTEYNVSSNEATFETEDCVLFRKRDIEELARRIKRHGARICNLSFDPGKTPFDREADTPPYYVSGRQHIKLVIGDYVATSLSVVIEKNK